MKQHKLEVWKLKTPFHYKGLSWKSVIDRLPNGIKISLSPINMQVRKAGLCQEFIN